jgi:hypothetical protein
MEGLKEMRKDLLAAIIARSTEAKLTLEQQFQLEKIVEEETSWLS